MKNITIKDITECNVLTDHFLEYAKEFRQRFFLRGSGVLIVLAPKRDLTKTNLQKQIEKTSKWTIQQKEAAGIFGNLLL